MDFRLSQFQGNYCRRFKPAVTAALSASVSLLRTVESTAAASTVMLRVTEASWLFEPFMAVLCLVSKLLGVFDSSG